MTDFPPLRGFKPAREPGLCIKSIGTPGAHPLVMMGVPVCFCSCCTFPGYVRCHPYLEVVENQRLVWTSTLGSGFRLLKASGDKDSCEGLLFTAMIPMEAHGSDTRDTAIAMH